VDAKARFAFPGSESLNDARDMSLFTLHGAVSSRAFLASPRNLSYPACLGGAGSDIRNLGMTKGRAALPFRLDAADDEQQVPPLRFAMVGMTLLLGTDRRRVEASSDRDDKFVWERQVSFLRRIVISIGA
jgi:hypothetical protein